jgi:hypothetical protein
MKTLEKALFFLVFAGLFVACNKDEAFLGEAPEIGLKAGPAGLVFMVQPSGGDDTPAIMQAFDDAKAAGPGSVVQLCEGEYHLGFIEVYDFCGALHGAGKGKTIITAMNNLDMSPLLARGFYPDLVKFVGGDVLISHLTIRTPPGRISVGGPGWGHILSLLSFSANNAEYEPLNESRSIKVVLDNISMKGQRLEAPDGYPGYVHNYNCAFAFWTAGDYRGWTGDPVPRQKVDIKVTNAEFDTFCYGAVFEFLKNSKIELGEKNNGNTFSNIDRAAGVWEGRDNEVVVAGNTFDVPAFSWALAIDDYPWYGYLKNETPQKPSLFDIRDNVFNLDHADIGLYFRNILSYYWGHIPSAIQVRNNQFNMVDGYEWAIGSLFSDGMVIRNNRFSGHGDLALWIVNYSKNGLGLGNNFSTARFETGVAYLTPSTSNWTFVGGRFKDKVIDLGVNNVFTGMNVSDSDIPLGRSISESLAPMNHLMNN